MKIATVYVAEAVLLSLCSFWRAEAIADDPIAIFHFRIRTPAESGTARLRIEKAEATMEDLKEKTLNSTEATVIIR